MKKKLSCISLILLIILTACTQKPSNYQIGQEISISPDYTGIVIPPNICPLNFMVEDSLLGTVDALAAKIYSQGSDTLWVHGKQEIQIPLKKWKNLITKNADKPLYIELYTKKSGTWTRHQTIQNHIAKNPIDPYLAYRFIQGSYEILGDCQLVQRCLENFDERVIISNSLAKGTCLNCHTFNAGNPNTLMFHVRFTNSGTVVYKDGQFLKTQTTTPELKINGVYPSWHPGGKYIAYSVNAVIPTVFNDYKRYMEAFDTLSDLAILDIETNTMITAPQLKTKEWNETQPAWTPDGKYLYFVRTPAPKFGMENDTTPISQAKVLAGIRYDLYRISFDESKGKIDSFKFGEPELILSSQETGKSISLPRISPDGKFLMFAMHDRGTFASWHRDADLYMMNLETGEWGACEGFNGRDADSYHSWSRNGSWIAFASKRIDGFYTRLYLGYVDAQGKTYKPFILPQKDPQTYGKQLYIYNLPEFITGPIPVSARELAKEVKKPSEKASYKYVGGVDSSRVDVLSGATEAKNYDDKKAFQ